MPHQQITVGNNAGEIPNDSKWDCTPEFREKPVFKDEAADVSKDEADEAAAMQKEYQASLTRRQRQ